LCKKTYPYAHYLSTIYVVKLFNSTAYGGTFFDKINTINKITYIFYIPSTSSGPDTCRRAHVVPPVEGLSILPARLALRASMAGRSILSKKWKFLYYKFNEVIDET